jgi:AAA family ATP:ADP antiporter
MSEIRVTDVNDRQIRSGLWWRALLLFTNFFLIIFAYYYIKPASRSLFIEYFGADSLPYVWIGTALFLGTVIGFYHKLVEHRSRLNVVLGHYFRLLDCWSFSGSYWAWKLRLAP